MTDAIPSEEEILRRALFVPCYTKQDLHRWICIYFGLNMPDTIVDPESNTSPMELIWEIYSKAMANDDANFSRVMAYASRDSFKTLGAAIIEALMVLHLDRDVAHMAAIKEQAKKAQSYVKKFFRLPFLRDYVISANTEKTEITWYHNETTGDVLTRDQYDELSAPEQMRYVEHARYIKIVIATMAGSNSEHVPFFVVDEVDVIPKQNQAAYEEAKSIPAVYQGKEPITLLTSTRKFAFGNVQRELDSADRTGLIVRHWNIIDVTERCPPSRHLPEKPRIPIWYSREDFSSITQEAYDKLGAEKQNEYALDEGYAGCLSKCKLFAMCRGNLATKQKDYPKDKKGKYVDRPEPLVKTLNFTTNKFRELNIDMAQAQLMCWKASQEGLIFPTLDKQKHLITPARVAELITGEAHPEHFAFDQLFNLIAQRDGRWVVGIDYGYTHNFAVTLLYIDGYRGFIFGNWSEPELDPAEKIDLLERTVKPLAPAVYADTEAPDMNKFLKKHGYRVKEWTKGPGSVMGGIETVRYKLTPGISGPPQLYFIDGAPGVNVLFDQLKKYHWVIGADGRPTKEPDEIIERLDGMIITDDSIDSFRYAVMNSFGSYKKPSVSPEEIIKVPTAKQVQQIQSTQKIEQAAWAKEIMQHALGYSNAESYAQEETPAAPSKGRKGGIFWEMG